MPHALPPKARRAYRLGKEDLQRAALLRAGLVRVVDGARQDGRRVLHARLGLRDVLVAVVRLDAFPARVRGVRARGGRVRQLAQLAAPLPPPKLPPPPLPELPPLPPPPRELRAPPLPPHDDEARVLARLLADPLLDLLLLPPLPPLLLLALAGPRALPLALRPLAAAVHDALARAPLAPAARVQQPKGHSSSHDKYRTLPPRQARVEPQLGAVQERVVEGHVVEGLAALQHERLRLGLASPVRRLLVRRAPLALLDLAPLRLRHLLAHDPPPPLAPARALPPLPQFPDRLLLPVLPPLRRALLRATLPPPLVPLRDRDRVLALLLGLPPAAAPPLTLPLPTTIMSEPPTLPPEK
ncbi:hypothetical protein FIBSPDRAFT_962916 [Athelia psychrophila]|uniref:Uncharacterized protein n=1 Tax=Athelia psychrophila TaxID=1759441 RepID=A0A165ZHM5_9AGAM|nr:hypothetical protein FIBSPDRAFT_962916 [Fibularhizoctonia sp. CBS 109695]